MNTLPAIGQLVTVNPDPDATVYRVEETQGEHTVRLSYLANGGMVQCAWVDRCVLEKPSRQQLINTMLRAHHHAMKDPITNQG
jgi:hypothetical protein